MDYNGHISMDSKEDGQNKGGLPAQVAETIEGLIAEKNWQPGVRLPSERKLAELFNVNVVAVGEALRTLEERGLVVRKVGSGTYVNAIPRSVIIDTIKRYFVFSGFTYENLIRVRASLEAESAAEAAEQATEQELTHLEELVSKMEAALKAEVHEDYAHHDIAFHEAVAEGSHNPLLIAIIHGLHGIVARQLQNDMKNLNLLTATWKNRSGSTHREVLEAIRRHDSKAAARGMKNHMRMALLSYQKYVKRRAVHLD